jgi:hypothetical protein
MKKAAFIFGAISVIVLAIGLLFKMHHWDGANIILVLGMLLVVLSLPIIAVYLSKTNYRYKNTYIYWAISMFIMVVGIFIKINHYAGSIILQTIGTGLFIFFTILFALKLFKTELK